MDWGQREKKNILSIMEKKNISLLGKSKQKNKQQEIPLLLLEDF
jgi:hypothetical protein